MTDIALIQLVPGLGATSGAGAYAINLCIGLEAAGFKPTIYKVAARRHDARELACGVMYKTITFEDALRLNSHTPTMLLYSIFKKYEEETLALIAKGVPMVFHAGAELKHPRLLEALRGRVAVGIRQPLVERLSVMGIKSHYIPHPYQPQGKAGLQKKRRAVAISRLDYAKHTNQIALANTMATHKCTIRGKANRMFVHHIMNNECPDWEQEYEGPFGLGEGRTLAEESELVVDLTYWKGDGGGTQYTFFEAWDVGTPLVVHTEWSNVASFQDRGTVVEGVNALAVTGPLELARLLDNPHHNEPWVIEGGYATLKQHDPKTIALEYVDLLGWR